ncbi:MAG TPA: hypothetical protein PLF01_03305 [Alphaproteobacteria bacterium]|nr:hypothetical protein [Alphaproteobacteria bacterium]
MSIFYAVTKQSKEGPEAAIAMALGAAVPDADEGVKNVHILLESVTQIDDVWVATVRIIIEPDMEVEEVPEDISPALESEELEEKRQYIAEDMALAQAHHKLVHEETLHELENISDSNDLSSLYVYTPTEYDDVYQAAEADIKPHIDKYDAYYPHVIEEGPLWEQVERGVFAHDDFYEATQEEQRERWQNLQDTFREMKQKYQRAQQLQMRQNATPALTEET